MNDLAQEIEAVNWSEFSTAYGVATKVPTLLEQLAGADPEKAGEAAHELWCGLCHQHAYVSSASLPSYPILLKILLSADDKLAVEILDILWGFAQCSAPGFGISPGLRTEWMEQLFKQMLSDIKVFEGLTASVNEDIRDFARWIVEELDKFR